MKARNVLLAVFVLTVVLAAVVYANQATPPPAYETHVFSSGVVGGYDIHQWLETKCKEQNQMGFRLTTTTTLNLKGSLANNLGDYDQVMVVTFEKTTP